MIPTNKCLLVVARVLLVSSLFLLGVATPARADAVYNYVGNPFNIFVGSYACPPECSITGSFTVPQPLAANFGPGFFPPPLSFSFTDGSTIFNNNDSSPEIGFFVGTDSGANITEWTFAFSLNGCNAIRCTELITNGFGLPGDTTDQFDSFAGIFNRARNLGPAGSWSIAATPGAPIPEPASILLVGTGLLVVVGAVRKKWLG